ncbi:MAG: YXWGXW repeat-containing protein [Myxococcales bacterium]
MAGTAILTAAIVSAAQPPAPRVVYAPPPRPGYTWQPGYWTPRGRRMGLDRGPLGLALPRLRLGARPLAARTGRILASRPGILAAKLTPPPQ